MLTSLVKHQVTLENEELKSKVKKHSKTKQMAIEEYTDVVAGEGKGVSAFKILLMITSIHKTWFARQKTMLNEQVICVT